jgi:ankyrin repeat protein
MFAAQSGSETAVTAVLNRGGLIDGSADGVTALMVAARAGNKPIVKLLLRMGADPSIKCGAYTAADYARYGGDDELADLISKAQPAN